MRDADKIVAIKDGQVSEIGSHDELMKTRGLYFSLVTAQMSEENEEDDGIMAAARKEEAEEAYNEMSELQMFISSSHLNQVR